MDCYLNSPDVESICKDRKNLKSKVASELKKFKEQLLNIQHDQGHSIRMSYLKRIQNRRDRQLGYM